MFVGYPFHPSNSGRRGERGIAEVRLEKWICAMSQQKFHQLDVAGLGCSDKRRAARFKKPLHRKYGSGQRVVFYAGIWIGSMLEEKLNVVQVLQIRFANREIAAFDIAVIGCEIKRGPHSFVSPVHIGAMLDQILREFVVPVVG